MDKGLNFRTMEEQEKYFKAYEETLQLWKVSYSETYIVTSYGTTHCLVSGDVSLPPLVLLHASSCSATIWYPNVEVLSKKYCIYAIDLITESSKSLLSERMQKPAQCAKWLMETLQGLGLKDINLCGLSIGGWHAANFAMYYPERVNKLILLSPIQTLTRIYSKFFYKIMKMGVHPTRKNVENYIGWGRGQEAPLPESVIEQFCISVMNMNPHIMFPKKHKKSNLSLLNMPVMILLGENEYSFNVNRAAKVAEETIPNLRMEIVDKASHLLSVSMPGIINTKILEFIME